MLRWRSEWLYLITKRRVKLRNLKIRLATYGLQGSYLWKLPEYQGQWPRWGPFWHISWRFAPLFWTLRKSGKVGQFSRKEHLWSIATRMLIRKYFNLPLVASSALSGPEKMVQVPDTFAKPNWWWQLRSSFHKTARRGALHPLILQISYRLWWDLLGNRSKRE